jgi:hypothetical protein
MDFYQKSGTAANSLRSSARQCRLAESVLFQSHTQIDERQELLMRQP